MPELPEVETMRRYVVLHVLGKNIVGINVALPKLLRYSPLPDLRLAVDHEFIAARRRAKILMLDLSNDLTLLLHCKLSGQMAFMLPNGERAVAGHPVPSPVGSYPHKSTHIRFDFEDGTILYYSDVRQFGWLRLLPTVDVEAVIAGFGFGPEAWGLEFDRSALETIMQRRGIPIKTLLLDQSFLAGPGNIYVDEALHASRVHPARASSSLSSEERARVLDVIPKVLEEGIKQGGAKIVHSKAYPIDDFPAVHAREGEPCIACGGTILKTRVGQRGTYFCPACQPMPVSMD